MKTINQEGKNIEVTNEFYYKYQEIERRDYNIEQKETRRHVSLSKAMDSGFDVEDTRPTAEEKQIQQDEYDELHATIAKLEPNEQELINAVYFEKKSMVEIAKEKGVTKQAICNKMRRILKKLKLFLS